MKNYALPTPTVCAIYESYLKIRIPADFEKLCTSPVDGDEIVLDNDLSSDFIWDDDFMW
jgi:hypothetical protein